MMPSNPLSMDVRKFHGMVIASRLCAAGQISDAFNEFLEGIRAPSSKGSDVVAFCDYLVWQKILTRWQCGKLLEGRFEGFFLDHYKLLERVKARARHPLFAAEDVNTAEKVLLAIIPNRLSKSGHVEYSVVHSGDRP